MNVQKIVFFNLQKEVKNAFDPSGKPSEESRIDAEKRSSTKITNVDKSEINWKGSPLWTLQRTQSSKETSINDVDDLVLVYFHLLY